MVNLIKRLESCEGLPVGDDQMATSPKLMNILPEHIGIANDVQQRFFEKVRGRQAPADAKDIPIPQRVRYMFVSMAGSTTSEPITDRNMIEQVQVGLGLRADQVAGKHLVVGVPIY